MSDLFRLDGASGDDPAVTAWFNTADPLREIARRWLDALCACGPDVTVLLHDGNPTACVSGAAFAYVAAYTAHAAVGFFHGADLPDPAGLLEGQGKRMRHVKLRWGNAVDDAALTTLIAAAFVDIHRRLAAEASRD